MNKDFGDFIRKLREEQNLTQKELAEKSGFTVVQIKNIERGKNIPRVFNLGKLANALNCDFDYLYERIIYND